MFRTENSIEAIRYLGVQNDPQISQRNADDLKSSPICGRLRNLWIILVAGLAALGNPWFVN
jgi:hypothetical protein